MDINTNIAHMEVFYRKWHTINTNFWDEEIEFSYGDMILKPLGKLTARNNRFGILSNILENRFEIPNYTHDDFYNKLKRHTLS